jgi:hypothetical protein
LPSAFALAESLRPVGAALVVVVAAYRLVWGAARTTPRML